MTSLIILSLTEEMQQLSEIKPYHIKFGCSENKCDYSQLFINLIKKAEFKSTFFFISPKDYDSIILDFTKVYDSYDKEAFKILFAMRVFISC